MPRLPLFPLGSVLYPGLVLPLHVFEPRYRRLVHDLVKLPAEEPRRFGVVALRAGAEVGGRATPALQAMGCAAHVRQVEAHEDGRFDLVCVGVERFRLGQLDTSRLYLQADVEWVPEDPGEGAALLAPAVRAAFAGYQRELGVDDPGAGLPSDPGVLSYAVAAAMVLDSGEAQMLLACPDDGARLRAGLDLLRREAGLLRVLPSLPAVDLLHQEVSSN